MSFAAPCAAAPVRPGAEVPQYASAVRPSGPRLEPPLEHDSHPLERLRFRERLPARLGTARGDRAAPTPATDRERSGRHGRDRRRHAGCVRSLPTAVRSRRHTHPVRAAERQRRGGLDHRTDRAFLRCIVRARPTLRCRAFQGSARRGAGRTAAAAFSRSQPPPRSQSMSSTISTIGGVPSCCSRRDDACLMVTAP